MSASAKPVDDLDALRIVIDAVKDFKSEDQQRIFRWAAEKLGLTPTALPPSHVSSAPHHTGYAAATPSAGSTIAGPSQGQDIKSFVAAKNPRTDQQFAATVAYWLRFEAPAVERQDSIGGDELQEACRKAGRARLGNPKQTLRNAHQYGLFDKAGEPGRFAINAVGENLVAMTLPGDGLAKGAPTSRAAKKPLAKKVARKSAKRSKKA